MVRNTRMSTRVNGSGLSPGRRVTTTPRIGSNRQGHLRLDACVPLLLLTFALVSVIVLTSHHRAGNRGGVAAAERAKEKIPKDLPNALFEELIKTHYQKEHGETATKYVSRRETKKELILTFVDHASEGDMSQCVALTDILFSGFCPPDLTDHVANLAAYPGPGRKKNLNEWVKQIEDLKIRVKVRLGNEVLERTQPLDWWILFCGVLEEFNSKMAQRCRGDLKLIRNLPKETIHENLNRDMHLIVGVAQDGPEQAPLVHPIVAVLRSVLYSHLRDYVEVLPDHYKFIDFKYSGEYVRIVGNLYRGRDTVSSRADFDHFCLDEVEKYLKGLMSDRSLDTVEFEFK